MIKISTPNINSDGAYEAGLLLGAGQIDPGTEAERFAQELARLWDVPRDWVLLTNSCTTALHIAARHFPTISCWRVPALTWPGTYCGLRKWTALDEINSKGIGAPEKTHICGHIIVDLFGGISDYRHYGNKEAPVIIDAAHHLNPGHLREGLNSGVDAVCFSFAPLKEITTLRGGALVSKWAAYYDAYVRYGTRARQTVQPRGINGTITEVGAAIGRAGLKNHEKDFVRRQNILQRYRSEFNHQYMFTQPYECSGHLAVLKFNTQQQRDDVAAALSTMRVETGHHYPIPEELQESCPNSTRLSNQLLTIPCHLNMTDDTLDFVVAATERAFKIAGL